MKKALVVIDMQKDFVSGSLANAAAQAIVMPIVKRIDSFRGAVFATRDTHGKDYLSTPEGKRLPIIHCVKDTGGWQIVPEIAHALEFKNATVFDKPAFGTLDWAFLEDFTEVELVGTCTDICVVSNALVIKTLFPALTVKVNAPLCAGTSAENHEAALKVMRSCQIDIVK
ncbi:MAG: cysteine hydrolase [Clostridia bacterium]|nr:cysteine hydrolase [Clostridia bacterium]